eukprot:jgi/Mesvir1/3747/Mv15022-RA.1
MDGLIAPTHYTWEPQRRNDLVINSKEPFNAEPPLNVLARSYITPTEYFYKRNHGPVPVLQDADRYFLSVDGLVEKPLKLSMAQIRALPKHAVVATLQCAGNRRTEMSKVRPVRGVGWGAAAVGNAVWVGALLKDVLAMAGVSKALLASGHVEFASIDRCKEEKGGPYRASIPLSHAMSPGGDVLLAYEMNGQELLPDHGHPLRVVVPGVIGARSVKWLTSVTVQREECQGFFQQNDYKMFPPSVNWDNVKWETSPPIMDFPVTCAICDTNGGQTVSPGSKVCVQGYALAGGGRTIQRVDVSPDGGATWVPAKILPAKLPDGAACEGSCEGTSRLGQWTWCLWRVEVVLNPPCTLVAKAVDSACNTQPERVDTIWNLRGVLNNAWFTARVKGESLHVESMRHASKL